MDNDQFTKNLIKAYNTDTLLKTATPPLNVNFDNLTFYEAIAVEIQARLGYKHDLAYYCEVFRERHKKEIELDNQRRSCMFKCARWTHDNTIYDMSKPCTCKPFVASEGQFKELYLSCLDRNFVSPLPKEIPNS